MTLKQIEL